MPLMVTPGAVITANPNQTAQQRQRVSRASPMRPMGVDEVINRLGALARRNEDFTVKGRDLTFNADGTLEVKSGPKVSWTDHSFSQFCAKLKIPVDFLRRCPNGVIETEVDGEKIVRAAPASKKAIVDYWKEQVDNSDFFVRTRRLDVVDAETGASGIARAFLSSRYAVLDNLELMSLHSNLIGANQATLHVGHISDKSFHARIILPGKEVVGPVEVGDLHSFGIHVRNSEVGACNIQEDFVIFRHGCSNGMLPQPGGGSGLIDIRHINIDRHQLRATLSGVVDQVEDSKEMFIGRLQMAHNINIEHPVRELHRFLRANRATEEFMEMAERAFEREPQNTRFGVIQAITRAAQALPTDQRVAMEETAGRLLLSA